MVRVALLHPQCVRQGGAVQMALQTAGILQEQGHEVILYTFSHSPECFSELQKNVKIQEWGRSVPHFFLIRKLILISTLAWHVRHVDIVIANNPPMQIVAALTKIFSRRHAKTVWWHHHIPWYLLQNDQGRKGPMTKMIKGFFERKCIIPLIDEMIATSHFVAEQIKTYCGRGATVIHPIIMTNDQGRKGKMKKGKETTSFPSFRHSVIPSLNAVTLFTHGRLEPGKGIETLVSIYKRLAQSTTLPTGRQEHKVQNGEPVSVISGDSAQGNGFLSRHLRTERSGDPEIQSETLQRNDSIYHSEISLASKKDPEINSGGREHGLDPWVRNSGLRFGTEDDGLQGRINIHLILFGTGSLEGKIKEQGIDVRPFDTRSTLHDLASGQFGHSILGVYCSEIDGFGMAPLESQMMDIPTVILDRAGSRETIVSNDVNEPVGYLVEDKEELFRIISHFVQKKVLPKCEANVNFLHHKAYFLRSRLSQDLFDFMRKIQDGE